MPSLTEFVSGKPAFIGGLLRILVALIICALCVTDARGLALKVEIGEAAALGYLALSLVSFLLLIFPLPYSMQISRMLIPVDAAMFVVLPFMRLHQPVDIVLVAPIMAMHIILDVNRKFGARSAMLSAVGLNLAYAINCTSSLLVQIPQFLTIRLLVALLLCSIAAIWLTFRLQHRPFPRWIVGQLEVDERVARSSLDFLALPLRCRSALVCMRKAYADEFQIIPIDCVVPSAPSCALQAEGVLLHNLADRFVMFKSHARTCFERGQDGGLTPVEESKEIIALLAGTNLREGIIAIFRTVTADFIMVLANYPLQDPNDLCLVFDRVQELKIAMSEIDVQGRARSDDAAAVRKTLARDLHDSVAQSLAGARFWLAGVLKSELPAEAKRELTAINAALTLEHKTLRRYIDDLRRDGIPRRLVDFERALRKTTTLLAEHWHVDITGAYDGPPKISQQITFDVQQLVREAIANAVRHGGATHLTVACFADATMMQMRISDNGRGFEPGVVVHPRSISERVELLNGVLEITSSAAGVVLAATLPLGDTA